MGHRWDAAHWTVMEAGTEAASASGEWRACSGKASWRKWQRSRGMEGAEELARRGGKQRGWGRAPRPEQRLEVGKRDRAAREATG